MNHCDLAMLCELAYADGIDGAEEIGGMGPMAFVLRGMPKIVVFRGTHDLAGWTQNLDARWAAGTWGHVHAGFLRSWDVLKRRVRQAVGGSPAILTGHSLGGALATLAAADLNGRTEVVTFGAPRVGDADFVERYAGNVQRVTRYVYQLDPVPWVPGWRAGYRHVGGAKWHDGTAWQDGFTFAGLLGMAWQLAGTWRGMLERLWKYHGIENYCEALK